jgi:hypothetical protein
MITICSCFVQKVKPLAFCLASACYSYDRDDLRLTGIADHTYYLSLITSTRSPAFMAIACAGRIINALEWAKSISLPLSCDGSGVKISCPI